MKKMIVAAIGSVCVMGSVWAQEYPVPMILSVNPSDGRYLQELEEVEVFTTVDWEYPVHTVMVEWTRDGVILDEMPRNLVEQESGRFSVSCDTLDEGRYVLRMVATNSVEQISDPLVTSFTVDRTAPTVEWLAPPAGQEYFQQSPMVQFRVDDEAGVSVNNTEITITHNDRPILDSETNWTAYGVCRVQLPSATEGVFQVGVVPVDRAGNRGNEVSRRFTIDQTPPSATAEVRLTAQDVVITVFDDLKPDADNTQVLLSQGGALLPVERQNYQGQQVIVGLHSLQPGQYQLTVYPRDAAGNRGDVLIEIITIEDES